MSYRPYFSSNQSTMPQLQIMSFSKAVDYLLCKFLCVLNDMCAFSASKIFGALFKESVQIFLARFLTFDATQVIDFAGNSATFGGL